MLKVSVQIEPFDVAQEQTQLTSADATIGAVASFVGLVRDTNTVGRVIRQMSQHSRLSTTQV